MDVYDIATPRNSVLAAMVSTYMNLSCDIIILHNGRILFQGILWLHWNGFGEIIFPTGRNVAKYHICLHSVAIVRVKRLFQDNDTFVGNNLWHRSPNKTVVILKWILLQDVFVNYVRNLLFSPVQIADIKIAPCRSGDAQLLKKPMARFFNTSATMAVNLVILISGE